MENQDEKLLTVVIGAGASYDCVEKGTDPNVDTGYRPPLVNELFEDRPKFNAILNRYPKARMASDEIRVKVKKGEPLEKVLRELQRYSKGNPNSDYYQIPLYLQELTYEISNRYIGYGVGSKFDTVVRYIERSKFGKVLYLTLNYDLFLDQSLSVCYNHSFDTMQSYIPDNKKWLLVKYHGSANWGVKVNNADATKRNAAGALGTIKGKIESDNIIRVLPGGKDDHRFVDGYFHYPAIAVPVEGKTSYVCNDEHVIRARKFIEKCQYFLFIGFSALDEHVLDLLSHAPEMKGFYIVGGSKDTAKGIFNRLRQHNVLKHDYGLNFGSDLVSFLYHSGFSNFVNEKLEPFLQNA